MQNYTYVLNSINPKLAQLMYYYIVYPIYLNKCKKSAKKIEKTWETCKHNIEKHLETV